MSRSHQAASRRRFLQFLAGSPLLATGGWAAIAAEIPTPARRFPDPLNWAPLDPEDLIKSPAEAINVFDFEPVCRKNVPPAHFGYMENPNILGVLRLLDPAQTEGTIAIEDAPKGVESAARAGMLVVAVETPYTAQLETPGAAVRISGLDRFDLSWIDAAA